MSHVRHWERRMEASMFFMHLRFSCHYAVFRSAYLHFIGDWVALFLFNLRFIPCAFMGSVFWWKSLRGSAADSLVLL